MRTLYFTATLDAAHAQEKKSHTTCEYDWVIMRFWIYKNTYLLNIFTNTPLEGRQAQKLYYFNYSVMAKKTQ